MKPIDKKILLELLDNELKRLENEIGATTMNYVRYNTHGWTQTRAKTSRELKQDKSTKRMLKQKYKQTTQTRERLIKGTLL